jgi:hypothetical protein
MVKHQKQLVVEHVVQLINIKKLAAEFKKTSTAEDKAA